ncbi:MAG: hypothetical protein M0006_01325 [Magnetospirillum sp.]|nr:hypothetical protein [Magnetospirillum sp.]
MAATPEPSEFTRALAAFHAADEVSERAHAVWEEAYKRIAHLHPRPAKRKAAALVEAAHRRATTSIGSGTEDGERLSKRFGGLIGETPDPDGKRVSSAYFAMIEEEIDGDPEVIAARAEVARLEPAYAEASKAENLDALLEVADQTGDARYEALNALEAARPANLSEFVHKLEIMAVELPGTPLDYADVLDLALHDLWPLGARYTLTDESARLERTHRPFPESPELGIDRSRARWRIVEGRCPVVEV